MRATRGKDLKVRLNSMSSQRVTFNVLNNRYKFQIPETLYSSRRPSNTTPHFNQTSANSSSHRTCSNLGHPLANDPKQTPWYPRDQIKKQRIKQETRIFAKRGLTPIRAISPSALATVGEPSKGEQEKKEGEAARERRETGTLMLGRRSRHGGQKRGNCRAGAASAPISHAICSWCGAAGTVAWRGRPTRRAAALARM